MPFLDPIAKKLLGGLSLLSLAAISGCSSGAAVCGADVESRARPGITFGRYQTFALKNPKRSLLSGKESSDLPANVEVLLKRANMEAGAALSKAGLEEVDPNQEAPDLWVTSAAASEVEDGAEWDCVNGWNWWGWYEEVDACRWVEPIPVEYRPGTLVVGVVDAAKDEVVFGGLASELLDCSGDQNASIELAVEEIFVDFPRN